MGLGIVALPLEQLLEPGSPDRGCLLRRSACRRLRARDHSCSRSREASFDAQFHVFDARTGEGLGSHHGHPVVGTRPGSLDEEAALPALARGEDLVVPFVKAQRPLAYAQGQRRARPSPLGIGHGDAELREARGRRRPGDQPVAREREPLGEARSPLEAPHETLGRAAARRQLLRIGDGDAAGLQRLGRDEEVGGADKVVLEVLPGRQGPGEAGRIEGETGGGQEGYRVLAGPKRHELVAAAGVRRVRRLLQARHAKRDARHRFRLTALGHGQHPAPDRRSAQILAGEVRAHLLPGRRDGDRCGGPGKGHLVGDPARERDGVRPRGYGDELEPAVRARCGRLGGGAAQRHQHARKRRALDRNLAYDRTGRSGWQRDRIDRAAVSAATGGKEPGERPRQQSS